MSKAQDTQSQVAAPKPGDEDFVRYDGRRLSYANTFSDPSKVGSARQWGSHSFRKP